MTSGHDDARFHRDAIRVVIADADGLARRTLRESLARAEGLAVVADTGDGREAVTLARYHRPSALLVDVDLPPHGVLDVVRRVVADLPAISVLVLSAREDDALAVEALRAGAAGHVSKEVAPERLPYVVAKACEGEPIVPRRLLRPVLDALREVPDAGWRPVRSRLTTREWEIVGLIADGTTTQDIADALVLAPTTVYSHVKSLMRKLGVHTRRDAVAAAERLRREEVVGEKCPIGS
ncbi:MAG TPA: response regulator transcription factor [Baekduia sp.]|nr:response regulator transcription factor [Baekduia sp.]